MQEHRGNLSRSGAVLAVVVGLVAIDGCAPRPAPATSPTSPPARAESALRSEVGLASYYGRGFHGRVTASGTRFDMRAAVAAHPDYPFGTRVRVTNLKNQRTVIVTIVDRGPSPRYQSAGIIIDVSQGAAEKLAFVRDGRTRVRLDVLQWGRK